MEERGSPRRGMSSLYEFMLLVRPDDDARRAGALYAVAELIKSGVTTFTDYSVPRRNWADDLAGTGIRACLSDGPIAAISSAWSPPGRSTH